MIDPYPQHCLALRREWSREKSIHCYCLLHGAVDDVTRKDEKEMQMIQYYTNGHLLRRNSGAAAVDDGDVEAKDVNDGEAPLMRSYFHRQTKMFAPIMAK